MKFSLGVSKFESNTLTLGELGRFPVELKAIRQSILYWLRLEQGTENPLLNLAFHDCKFLKMNWLTNIQQLLSSNGLGNVWDNVSKLHKGYVKSKVKQRFQDIHIQHYNSYIGDDNIDNYEKCFISKLCSNPCQSI